MRTRRSLTTATLLAVLAGPASAQRQASPPDALPGGEPGLGQRLEGELGHAVGGSGASGGQGSQAALQRALGWLHQTNATAIQGGQLAEQKGSTSRVRQLGSKLVGDHTALQQEVLAVAKARGISLPGAASAGGAGLTGLAALEKLRGHSFDSAFLKWLGTRQQKDAQQAKNVQASARQAGDPVLAGLAGKLVPQLESHAQTAQQAQRPLDTQRHARTPPGSTP